MQISGQLHTPAVLLTGKDPWILTVLEVGWTPKFMFTYDGLLTNLQDLLLALLGYYGPCTYQSMREKPLLL
jgi:hypothetical protein